MAPTLRRFALLSALVGTGAIALTACAGRAPQPSPFANTGAAGAARSGGEGNDAPAGEIPDPSPLFEVAVGAAPAPLAGSEQNRFLLPCGGGPASLDVDEQGRWWVLDAIASRVVVLRPDGTVERVIALPSATTRDKSASYHPDLALAGSAGLFVLNASRRRVERFALDGAPHPDGAGFGAEKIPRAKGEAPLLELPERISITGGELFVADDGSETLLRFDLDGSFRGAIPGADMAPAGGGHVYLLGADDDGSFWLETWPEIGPLGLPTHKRVARIIPSTGRVVHQVALLGATPAGEAVVALVEGNDEQAERVRVMRFDRDGKRGGEIQLPVPNDDANPVRRWRVTRAGNVAWFRIRDGRFQAFERAF